ncbi:MAG: 50S ribosomal protein L4 [Gemmatimonadota bacterium]|nr:50S ribosomal protein L4 [Gemmatimonadota bacterium]MDE2986311.1 50S ribosomal protein L4 [Gemmatimonadota bacterium]
MYQAPYFKTDGSAGSEVTLPGSLFNGVIHEGALHQAVTAYLANQRQGSASKKNRSAVRGGSRKPWRQKGTGRARQGTIRAVQWRGGGRAFPPQPRSWTQRLPKRIRALARTSAFNSRAEAGRVAVIEGFDFEAPRTRDLTELLGKLDQPGKVLFLTHGVNRELYLSGRNLPGVRVLPFGTESPYDVVWSGTLVIEEAALEGLGDAPVKEERAKRRPLQREPEPASEAGGEES